MSSLRGWAAALLLALAFAAHGGSAHGQSVPADAGRAAGQASAKDQARNFFNAGVRAYKAGQFLAAARAFVEAHKLLSKPQLLFSIAQAYRRQFHVGQKPAYLRLAEKYYRRYLSEVKEGGRRLEAARALSELAPFIAKLEGSDLASAELAAAETRLMVSTSAPKATVAVDGAAPRPAPLSLQLEPGRHEVVVQADGYFAEKRKVVVPKGGLVALDVHLRGKPALLDVKGEEGAEIFVDGQSRGEAPLTRPLPLEAGRYLVAVVRNGHKPHEQLLDVKRGESKVLTVDLPQTGQRTGAYLLFGTAAGTAVAAGVLAALAVRAEEDANRIRAVQASGTITEQQRSDHNSAIEQRDALVLATEISAVAGGAVALGGLLLFAIDSPNITTIRPEDLRRPNSSEPAADEAAPAVEVVGSLSLWPGYWGASAIIRY